MTQRNFTCTCQTFPSVPGVIKPIIHKLEQNLEQLYKPLLRFSLSSSGGTRESYDAKMLENLIFFIFIFKVIKLCHQRDQVK